MKALQAVFANAAPVLPPFRQERAPLSRALLRTLFLLFCAFLGLVYGLIFAVFPPFLMIYASLPIIMLALIVIWALPDQGRAPGGLLTRLFFIYLVAVVLWPNYLAIQLPGLPWISLRRLIAFPMALVLLICLSVSARFRGEMGQALRAAPALWKMLVAFAAVQIVTMFISAAPFASLNIIINNFVLLFAVFFIAVWVAQRESAPEKISNFIIVLAVIMCLIGCAEAYNQEILWARHIPSFLAVNDESVQRTLTAAFREGVYRVTGTYTVSLALAEFLALATPFVLQKLGRQQGMGGRLFYLAIDALLLVVIVFTRARLGILGWLVAHVVWGCLWAYRRWRQNKADVLGPAITIAVPIAALVFGVAMFTVDAVKYRTIGGGSTAYSDQARWDQLDGTWPLVLKNPLGYGVGMGGETLGFRTPGGQLTVDTYIITLLLDTGVAGFALFVGIFGYAAFRMLRISLRNREPDLDISLALCAVIATYLMIRLVLAQDDNAPLMYILLGVVTGICWRAQRHDRDRTAEGEAIGVPGRR